MSAILLAYVSGAVDFSRALNPDAADAHFCALAGAILGCLLSQFVNQCDGVSETFYGGICSINGNVNVNGSNTQYSLRPKLQFILTF